MKFVILFTHLIQRSAYHFSNYEDFTGAKINIIQNSGKSWWHTDRDLLATATDKTHCTSIGKNPKPILHNCKFIPLTKCKVSNEE